MSYPYPTESQANLPSTFQILTNSDELPTDLLSNIDSDIESEDDYTEPASGLNGNSTRSGSRTLVGRKKNEFTLILERFYTKNSKNPKKEFINTFIIRSIRRFFRNAIINKQPIKTCLAISDLNKIQKESWTSIKNMYLTDPAYFNKISLTTSSPLTDGKAKRKERNIGKVARSHNNEFCKNFFADKRMQKAFYILMDLLFADSDPNQLKIRFKFYCCVHLVHFEECFEKWNELKRYFYYKYLKDLDLTVDEEFVELASKTIRIERTLVEIEILDDILILGDLDGLLFD